MSHFYGSMQGKGVGREVTRTGSKKSGINAHIRGRDKGVCIEAYVDKDGEDQFQVFLTSGSNNTFPSKIIYDSSK